MDPVIGLTGSSLPAPGKQGASEQTGLLLTVTGSHSPLLHGVHLPRAPITLALLVSKLEPSLLAFNTIKTAGVYHLQLMPPNQLSNILLLVFLGLTKGWSYRPVGFAGLVLLYHIRLSIRLPHCPQPPFWKEP